MSTIESALQTALKQAGAAQDDLVKSTPQLDHALSNSAAKGLPPIAIGPSQGAFLSSLCQLMGSKSILEIGTLGGYSTMWFATSVPDVKVTSLEINPKHRDIALENLNGLDNVEIVLGAALDTLPKLAEQGKVYDFIFIDADWLEPHLYFDWAVKLAKPGAAIYVDNVVRQLNEVGPDGTAGLGYTLIDHVKKDERVQASLIPILSTHKSASLELVDGFILAIVK